MKFRVYKDIDPTDTAALMSAVRAGYAVTVIQGEGNGAVAPKKRRVFRRRLKGPVPKQAKAHRDKEIVQLRNNGWPFTRIGKRYGISPARACQVYTRDTKKTSKVEAKK